MPTIGLFCIYPHRSTAILNMCPIVDNSRRTLSLFTDANRSAIQSSISLRLTSDIYLSVTGWHKKRFSRLNSCFSPRFVGVISLRYRLTTSENNVSGCSPCDCNSIFFSSSAPHNVASAFVEQVLDLRTPFL